MLLPDDPCQLIHSAEPDFRCDGWEYSFGRYQWFYVVGARVALAKNGLNDLSKAANQAENVLAPKSWAENYSTLEWSNFSPAQVRRALQVRPMRFDKACLSIIAIRDVLSKEGKEQFLIENKDRCVSHWIKIRPATFEIPGLSGISIPSDMRASMLSSAYQTNPKFLPEIMVGHGATYYNLKCMADYLNSHKIGPASVHSKSGRSANAKRPAPSELVSFRKDPTTGEII